MGLLRVHTRPTGRGAAPSRRAAAGPFRGAPARTAWRIPSPLHDRRRCEGDSRPRRRSPTRHLPPLNHLCRTIAVELARHRINVNAIEPGWIDTPGERAVFGEEIIRSEGQKLPWGRIGTIEDVGRAAAFLCSDDADYITGAILRVDGLIVYKDCAAEF